MTDHSDEENDSFREVTLIESRLYFPFNNKMNPFNVN
jgi:hypothetical protein